MSGGLGADSQRPRYIACVYRFRNCSIVVDVNQAVALKNEPPGKTCAPGRESGTCADAAFPLPLAVRLHQSVHIGDGQRLGLGGVIGTAAANSQQVKQKTKEERRIS